MSGLSWEDCSRFSQAVIDEYCWKTLETLILRSNKISQIDDSVVSCIFKDFIFFLFYYNFNDIVQCSKVFELIQFPIFFFFYSKYPSLVGCSSCPHQDRPVVEKLSRSRAVGPQTLGAQCGTYFGADEEVKSVANVCLAEWA